MLEAKVEVVKLYLAPSFVEVVRSSSSEELPTYLFDKFWLIVAAFFTDQPVVPVSKLPLVMMLLLVVSTFTTVTLLAFWIWTAVAEVSATWIAVSQLLPTLMAVEEPPWLVEVMLPMFNPRTEPTEGSVAIGVMLMPFKVPPVVMLLPERSSAMPFSVRAPAPPELCVTAPVATLRPLAVRDVPVVRV